MNDRSALFVDEGEQIDNSFLLQRENMQKRVFSGWISQYLSHRGETIQDISQDLRSGVLLIHLLEELTGRPFPIKYYKKPRSRIQYLENVKHALKFIQTNLKIIVRCGSTDIVDGKTNMTLGLIWLLINKFSILSTPKPSSELTPGGGLSLNLSSVTNDPRGHVAMTPRSSGTAGKKALLHWTRNKLSSYEHLIKVHNFSSSWSSGIAFCALVHACDPNIIEYPSKFDSDDPQTNLSTAFTAAETFLKIPQLLEVGYFVDNPKPDPQVIMTYVTFFKVWSEAHEVGRKSPRNLPVAPASDSDSDSASETEEGDDGDDGAHSDTVDDSDTETENAQEPGSDEDEGDISISMSSTTGTKSSSTSEGEKSKPKSQEAKIISSLRKQVHALQTELELATSQADTNSSQSAHTDDEYKSLSDTIISQKAQILTLKAKILQMEADMEIDQPKESTAAVDESVTPDTRDEEISSLKAKISLLESQSQSQEHENQPATVSPDESSSQIVLLQESVSSLTDEIALKDANAEDLKSQILTLKKTINELEDSNNKLLDQIALQKDYIIAKETELEIAQTSSSPTPAPVDTDTGSEQIAELTSQLEAKTNELNSLKVKITSLEAQISENSAQISATPKPGESDITDDSVSRNEFEELEDKCEDLEISNSSLKDQLQSANDTIGLHLSKIADLTFQIDELKGQLASQTKIISGLSKAPQIGTETTETSTSTSSGPSPRTTRKKLPSKYPPHPTELQTSAKPSWYTVDVETALKHCRQGSLFFKHHQTSKKQPHCHKFTLKDQSEPVFIHFHAANGKTEKQYIIPNQDFQILLGRQSTAFEKSSKYLDHLRGKEDHSFTLRNIGNNNEELALATSNDYDFHCWITAIWFLSNAIPTGLGQNTAPPRAPSVPRAGATETGYYDADSDDEDE